MGIWKSTVSAVADRSGGQLDGREASRDAILSRPSQSFRPPIPLLLLLFFSIVTVKNLYLSKAVPFDDDDDDDVQHIAELHRR
ncbi:hypothetical protein BR93DRAFT_926672 [Coniochaeta sp. PMI_546]|nr:hypothetical protein BR93DRAFT_926672 [Coniochaeta sp. PMI_546]